MIRKYEHTPEPVRMVKLSQNMRKIGNGFYYLMKTQHQGKERTICGAAIAEQLSSMLGIPVTKYHIWRVAQLLIRMNKLSVCSWVKGYYVDDSFGALRDSLRFMLTQYAAMKESIISKRDQICAMYGDNVLPSDIEDMIAEFEEEDDEELEN